MLHYASVPLKCFALPYISSPPGFNGDDIVMLRNCLYQRPNFSTALQCCIPVIKSFDIRLCFLSFGCVAIRLTSYDQNPPDRSKESFDVIFLNLLDVIVSGSGGEDIMYINWLHMARAGLMALEFYSPDTKAWRQAHMQVGY